jgi:RNA polymerase sigma-70 factor (ECF subfamily)
MDRESKEGCREPTLAERTHALALGDEHAWRWFHEHYYLALLRYASQRLGGSSSAGDVVQETYLRIARHARPFADPEAFWRWLACLVRCAAADHSRGSLRRLLVLEKFAHWRASRDSEDHTWSFACNSAALAEEALLRLPLEDATLLRRKYYEGRSTRELATDFSSTPKGIESRLARLRERLREIILRLS